MPGKQSGAFVCAFVFLLIGFIVSLFNIGFGVTLIIVDAFLLVAYLVINFLEKQEKSKKDELDTCASSDAVSHKDKLCSEFEKLVTEIAHYQARTKIGARIIKEGELKEKVLVSPEDMDKAFLEAIENLYVMNLTPASPSLSSFFLGCDKESSLIEKIRAIRKLYEPKTP